MDQLVGNDNGLGWALILIDTLCSEYKWTLDYALYELPLAQAFALYAAISARYEVTFAGPTYAEQELIAKYFHAKHKRNKRKAPGGRTDH